MRSALILSSACKQAGINTRQPTRNKAAALRMSRGQNVEGFFVLLKGRNEIGAAEGRRRAGPGQKLAGELEADVAGARPGGFEPLDDVFGDADAGDFVVQPYGKLRAGERPESDERGDGRLAAEPLQEVVPDGRVEDRLGHGEVGPGLDLLLEAAELFVEVVGCGVDGDADGEVRAAAQGLARPVVALVETRKDADQADGVDFVNAAHLGVVAEDGRVAGDGEDVPDAAHGPGAEQDGLQADDVQVARGEVRDGFHPGLLDGAGEHDGVHAHAGQGAAVDVDRVHAAGGFAAALPLENAVEVDALGWVDLDRNHELPLLQLAVEGRDRLGGFRRRRWGRRNGHTLPPALPTGRGGPGGKVFDGFRRGGGVPRGGA